MIKNEKLVYDGFHKVVEIETEMKNQKVIREKLLVKSAVAGMVVDEDGKIGLVTQYRPVIEQYTKEIPAGLLDKSGLTSTEILIEELLEECEIPKEDILSISEKPVHEYYMMAGSSDAFISLYVVHVKKQENKVVSDADVDSVEWVDLPTMNAFIQDGIIADGKTILTYHYLMKNLKEI